MRTYQSTTAQAYNTLGDAVFRVNATLAAQYNEPVVQTGDQIDVKSSDGSMLQSYQVLRAVDGNDPADGYPKNGMQALAAAPIVDGKPDLTSIIVSYSGSDPTDIADVLTDAETIVGGADYYAPLDGSPVLPNQVTTGKQFADEIIKQYGAAVSYVFTGKSLGGYVAQAVAAEEKMPAYVFVGPNPTNSLSSADYEWAQQHLNAFTDIRNIYDLFLGAYGGNGFGDVQYYDEGNLGPINSHMPNYQFNADGSLNEPRSELAGQFINGIMTLPDPIASPLAAWATGALALYDDYAPQAVKTAVSNVFNLLQL